MQKERLLQPSREGAVYASGGGGGRGAEREKMNVLETQDPLEFV